MGIRHLVNGQVCRAIDCEDRGLAYGDGVFTTMAVRDQRPCLWPLHHRRLQRDCRALGIAFTAWEKLRREVFAFAADCAMASIKVIITRGGGKRAYRPPPADEADPTRIVILDPRPPPLFDHGRPGALLTVCRLRLSRNESLAGVKHLNRLEQVLARSEWRDEYAEGLMLDRDGAVIEGTMSNVFIWSGNTLRTPSLAACGVSGIMRQYLIARATAQGVPWSEQSLQLDDFYRADGAFLCNALIGLWPIKRIKRHELPLDGALAALLRQITEDLRTEHLRNP